jgi:hypothetical protein
MLPAEAVKVKAHNMMRQIILDSLRISPSLARFKQKTHNTVSGRSHNKVPYFRIPIIKYIVNAGSK